MSIKYRVRYDSVYGIWGKKILMVEEKFKYNKTIVYIPLCILIVIWNLNLTCHIFFGCLKSYFLN